MTDQTPRPLCAGKSTDYVTYNLRRSVRMPIKRNCFNSASEEVDGVPYCWKHARDAREAKRTDSQA